MRIGLELPEKIVPIISTNKRDFSHRIKQLVVLELFREGKISSGKAAEILGMERILFFNLLSEQKIPYFDLTKEELKEDIGYAKKGE